MRQYLRFENLIREVGAGACAQLLHHLRPAARGGLVGGHRQACDGPAVLQRGKGDSQDRGDAIGVGDDGGVSQCCTICLRHDKGHVWVHAEGRGVVDYLRAFGHGKGGEFLGDRGTGREKCNINPFKAEFIEFLNDHIATAESHPLPSRAGGSEQAQL